MERNIPRIYEGTRGRLCGLLCCGRSSGMKPSAQLTIIHHNGVKTLPVRTHAAPGIYDFFGDAMNDSVKYSVEGPPCEYGRYKE